MTCANSRVVSLYLVNPAGGTKTLVTNTYYSLIFATAVDPVGFGDQVVDTWTPPASAYLMQGIVQITGGTGSCMLDLKKNGSAVTDQRQISQYATGTLFPVCFMFDANGTDTFELAVRATITGGVHTIVQNYSRVTVISMAN